MELVCRPSRRTVSTVLAETSVCPGLFLQLSVCVHLCVISSALSVPVRSLQKSLGLVIPLLATLHNICHDMVIRDPATSVRALAFVSSHTHTQRETHILFVSCSHCYHCCCHFFPSFLTFFFTQTRNRTALWSNSINVLPPHSPLIHR